MKKVSKQVWIIIALMVLLRLGIAFRIIQGEGFIFFLNFVSVLILSLVIHLVYNSFIRKRVNHKKDQNLMVLLTIAFIVLPMIGAFFRIVYGNNSYTNLGLILVLATEGIVIGKIIFDSYNERNKTKKANSRMLNNHN